MFTNKQKIVILLCFAIVVTLALTKCGSGPDIVPGRPKTIESEEDNFYAKSQEDQYPKSDEAQLTRYSGQKFSVSYPSAWNLTENKTSGVVIKDTDREVVLGGVAPDDFYVETSAGNVVNEKKYSTKYAVITADYYEKSEATTWREFFDQFDVVEKFEKYSGQVPSGMEAAVVTKVSGLFPGQKRVFLRQGKNFLDLSLFVSGEDQKIAGAVFDQVISSVSF